MAKSMNQKGKILYLEKILRETGENRTCTMQDILGRLMEYGIRAERKSIYDDMEVLRSFGMDIQFKRGKPGGYYLAGQTAPEESSDGVLPVSPGKMDTKENVAEGAICSWLVQDTETEGEEKPVKLICRNSRKTEVMNTLGEFAQYREKEDNTFVAIVQVKENEKFFGWLAGMGRDVIITKPKKVVQAYRDYLKSILKEYK